MCAFYFTYLQSGFIITQQVFNEPKRKLAMNFNLKNEETIFSPIIQALGKNSYTLCECLIDQALKDNPLLIEHTKNLLHLLRALVCYHRADLYHLNKQPDLAQNKLDAALKALTSVQDNFMYSEYQNMSITLMAKINLLQSLILRSSPKQALPYLSRALSQFLSVNDQKHYQICWLIITLISIQQKTQPSNLQDALSKFLEDQQTLAAGVITSWLNCKPADIFSPHTKKVDEEKVKFLIDKESEIDRSFKLT